MFVDSAREAGYRPSQVPSSSRERSSVMAGLGDALRFERVRGAFGIIAGGEVPEWLNGAVSKTVVARWVTVGSNPTLSAS